MDFAVQKRRGQLPYWATTVCCSGRAIFCVVNRASHSAVFGIFPLDALNLQERVAASLTSLLNSFLIESAFDKFEGKKVGPKREKKWYYYRTHA